jgi:hypothetical protein
VVSERVPLVWLLLFSVGVVDDDDDVDVDVNMGSGEVGGISERTGMAVTEMIDVEKDVGVDTSVDVVELTGDCCVTIMVVGLGLGGSTSCVLVSRAGAGACTGSNAVVRGPGVSGSVSKSSRSEARHRI